MSKQPEEGVENVRERSGFVEAPSDDFGRLRGRSDIDQRRHEP